MVCVRSTQPHTGGARDHSSLAEDITALPFRDVAIETSNYVYRGTEKKRFPKGMDEAAPWKPALAVRGSEGRGFVWEGTR